MIALHVAGLSSAGHLQVPFYAEVPLLAMIQINLCPISDIGAAI
jgi:hypothetical protein